MLETVAIHDSYFLCSVWNEAWLASSEDGDPHSNMVPGEILAGRIEIKVSAMITPLCFERGRHVCVVKKSILVYPCKKQLRE